jgi:hypothetical protein
VKSQFVRILDVAIIGPVMIAGGRHLYRNRPVLGGLLFAFGVGTVIYNARNYFRLAEADAAPGEPDQLAISPGKAVFFDPSKADPRLWSAASAEIKKAKPEKSKADEPIAEGTEEDPYVLPGKGLAGGIKKLG